jgi:hypothetical protein
MKRKAYMVLGWVAWKLGSRVARRKFAQNKPTLRRASEHDEA